MTVISVRGVVKRAAGPCLALWACLLVAPALTQEAAPAVDAPQTSATPPAPWAPFDFLNPGAGLRGSLDAPAPISQTLSEVEANRETLRGIEESITLSQERRDQLRAEIEELSGDRARQSAELIAAAQRVKLAEIEIGAMEERLSSLLTAQAEVRERLDGADAQVGNLFAALERISRNPPPALIVNPNDALGSARSAMLLSAILPELRAKAEAVAADLERLDDIKTAALEEEAQLRANHAILEEEQLRIATLITARNQGVNRVTAELEAEEAEATRLAERATSLQGLIETLSTRISAVTEAAAAAAAANAGGPTPQLSPETIRIALANTERAEPAIPFSSARGYLNMPANGTAVLDYGASDGFGGISQGLAVMTRAGAQVVAPADGWVMYKGKYLNYGEIVILNAGQDYTILLAGLEAVSVNIGQFVLMGEPVGTMGSRTIGRTITTSAGNSRPTLYIEMRKSNAPMDPTGWWASQATSTQNG